MNPNDWVIPERDQFETEDELSTHVLGALERHFHIEEQVPGVHWTGTPVRLDAVCRPRDPARWHDEAPAFGIEFKRPGSSAVELSMGDHYKWLRQAIDYTNSEFRDVGRVQVFLCPSPVINLMREGLYSRPLDERQQTASELMHCFGQLGVGELMPTRSRGWALFRSRERLWSERQGVSGRMFSLHPRVAQSKATSNPTEPAPWISTPGSPSKSTTSKRPPSRRPSAPQPADGKPSAP